MMFKGILCALAAMLMPIIAASASESPLHGYGNSGINKMFLDARAPDQPPNYSRSDIRRMIKGAKTSRDFSRLADYFDYQSLMFEQKADEQLKELERLVALPFHARSYAMQVENTRGLIREYRHKADECTARAGDYRSRAFSAPPE